MPKKVKKTKKVKKEKPIMCWNCGKYPAEFKDYREVDGVTGKQLSCRYCVNLSNVYYYKVGALGLDPKDVLEGR